MDNTVAEISYFQSVFLAKKRFQPTLLTGAFERFFSKHTFNKKHE